MPSIKDLKKKLKEYKSRAEKKNSGYSDEFTGMANHITEVITKIDALKIKDDDLLNSFYSLLDEFMSEYEKGHAKKNFEEKKIDPALPDKLKATLQKLTMTTADLSTKYLEIGYIYNDLRSKLDRRVDYIEEDTKRYLDIKDREARIAEKKKLEERLAHEAELAENMSKESFTLLAMTKSNVNLATLPGISNMMKVMETEEPKDNKELADKVTECKAVGLALATKLAEYSIADKTRFLNIDELTSLKNSYDAYLKTIDDVLAIMPENGKGRIAFTTARETVDKQGKSAAQAIAYIEKNANKEDVKKVKAFSIFELSGTKNPDVDGNLLAKAGAVLKAGEALRIKAREKHGKGSPKIFQEPGVSGLDDLGKYINELTDKLMPELLGGAAEGYLKTVDRKDVEKLATHYYNIYIKLFNINNELKTVKEPDEDHKAMMQAIEKLMPQIGYKAQLCDFISEKEDNEIKQLIDRSAKGEVLTDAQKKLVERATQMRLLFDAGEMYAQFIFEDPMGERASGILSMRRKEQPVKKDYMGLFDLVIKQDKDRLAEYPDSKIVTDILKINTEGMDKDTAAAMDQLKDVLLSYATEMIAHMAAEKGKTRYLSKKEIDDLFIKSSDVEEKLDQVKNKFPENSAEAKALNALASLSSRRSRDLHHASRYVEENAGVLEADNVRAFSAYELLNIPNPEMTREADKLVNTLKEKIAAYGNMNDRNVKYLEYAMKTAADMEKLYRTTIPGMMAGHADNQGFIPTLSNNDLKKLAEDYENIIAILGVLKESHEARYAKKKAPKEADELYKSVVESLDAMEEKKAVIDYIRNPKDTKLMDRIEKFRGDDTKKADFDKAVKTLQYAEQLRLLNRDGQLFAMFLFEDPNSQRATTLVGLKIMDERQRKARETEQWLERIEWTGNSRDLSRVPEYKTMMMQQGKNDGWEVRQYSPVPTKEMIKQIIRDEIANWSENLRNMKCMVPTAVLGQKEERTVEEALLKYVDETDDPADLFNTLALRKDEHGNVMTDEWAGGMFEPFEDLITANDRKPRRERDAGLRRLKYNLNELNRKLSMAGFNQITAEAKVFNSAGNIEGYNEGKAKETASKLFGNRLLPEVSVNEMDVYIGGVNDKNKLKITAGIGQKNYNENRKQNGEYFTTVHDFRRSEFIAGSDVGAKQKIVELQTAGLSEQQIQEKLREIRNDLEHQPLERRKMTTEVNDYDSYNKGNILADIADLQAMDYLLGIPVRKPHELRIGFKTDADGSPVIDSVSGAYTKDMSPFAPLKPGNAKLTKPDNMMIMTEEMANKILNWGEQDDAKLEGLPQVCKDAFKQRLDTLKAKILAAKSDFEVVEEVRDGDEKVYSTHAWHQFTENSLRIIKREDFKHYNIDELAKGRNNTAPGQEYESLNLFDTLSKLPKAGMEGLRDKSASMNGNDKEFGKKPDNGMWWDMMQKDPKFEREFLAKERSRFLGSSPYIIQRECKKMDVDRSLEPDHEDSGKYSDVFDKQVKLMQAAAQVMMNASREKQQGLGIYTQKQQAAMMKEAQDYARNHHLIVPDGVDREQKPLMDPLRMAPVRNALADLKKSVETYLLDRRPWYKPGGPKSDFGKRRYEHMERVYEEVNRQIEAYIAVTGDDTLKPQVYDKENKKFVNKYTDKQIDSIRPKVIRDFENDPKNLDEEGKLRVEAESIRKTQDHIDRMGQGYNISKPDEEEVTDLLGHKTKVKTNKPDRGWEVMTDAEKKYLNYIQPKPEKANNNRRRAIDIRDEINPGAGQINNAAHNAQQGRNRQGGGKAQEKSAPQKNNKN